MKKTKLIKMVSITGIILLGSINLQANSFWEDTKSAVSVGIDKAGEAISSTTTKVVNTVEESTSDSNETIIEKRRKINNNYVDALHKLFNQSTDSQELYNKSYGVAVFNSREFAFLIKTSFGSGVAVNLNTEERTYMKMASGGLNLGGGIKYIQIIFIFTTKDSFNNFVENGWDASSNASAIAGDDSVVAGLTLEDGTKVYEIVDTGVMLKVSIEGTKYWKNENLN